MLLERFNTKQALGIIGDRHAAVSTSDVGSATRKLDTVAYTRESHGACPPHKANTATRHDRIGSARTPRPDMQRSVVCSPLVDGFAHDNGSNLRRGRAPIPFTTQSIPVVNKNKIGPYNERVS